MKLAAVLLALVARRARRRPPGCRAASITVNGAGTVSTTPNQGDFTSA
jgi:hypothetical protein